MTKREIKSVRVEVKSTDDETGRFKALVSVFGNVDAYGDVMMPGSFSKSLASWKEAGDPIPFLWDHQIDDPFSYIGEVEAKESAEGLEVDGRFDLDEPKAAKAYQLLKGRRVREWSFGFIIPKGGARYVEEETDEGFSAYREVNEVELLEVSMTLVGANRATRTLEVRSAPSKAGTQFDDGMPEVKATETADTAAGSVRAVGVPELDAVLDALQAGIDELGRASGILEATKGTVKAARDELERKEADEPGTDADGPKSGTTDHAAASTSTAADEEPTEVKSDASANAAAANVKNAASILAIQLAQIRATS